MIEVNRLNPRVVSHLPAEYRRAGSDQWRPCTLHDVSASGAAVLTEVGVPLKAFLSLRFSIPAQGEGEPAQVLVECLAVRTILRPDLDPGRPHFLGVIFLDLHGAAYEHVRRYVWERLAEDER